jgi:hypothetical protein
LKNIIKINLATIMQDIIIQTEQMSLNDISENNSIEKIIRKFENYNIEIIIEDDNPLFKLYDLTKALDIIIAPENIDKFNAEECVQRMSYNKKGVEQLTNFLTFDGVYKFIYATDLQSDNDLSDELSNLFKSWVKAILVEYKKCKCNSDKPIKLDVNRMCRSCKIQKEIDLFEVYNKKGDRKSSCIECIDKTTFTCKKCTTQKLGNCYKFSDNNIRQRTCNECNAAKPPTLKLCKKCNGSKPTTEFGRYDSGDLHAECGECYKLVTKRDIKKCRRCEKSLPVEQFKVLDNNKRNRICDNCRG